MSNLFKNKKIWIFWSILSVFMVTRFLAVGQIYHQDEYRWAVIANPVFDNFSGPHPPFTKYTLRYVGGLIGYDHLRFIILTFGFLNLFLVYKIIKKVMKETGAALLGMALATVSVYTAIANLQIDIDGATLPFFILLTYYAYIHLLEARKARWMVIFGIAILGGFLTKISFVLFLGALILDYFFVVYGTGQIDLKKALRKVAKPGALVLLMGAVFYYFYAHGSGVVIQYAKNFKSLNFESRAYFDLAFKVMKSFVWLSPLLLLPSVAGLFQKDVIRKYRIWYFYLLFNLLFYLVLFDFATLTIERYFMFLIVPTTLIASGVIYPWLKEVRERGVARAGALIVALFAGLSGIILTASHVALPLNPKSAYVEHIKSLDFNFLLPLTGGSGPSGFYFSATYILIIWLLSVLFLVVALWKKPWRVYGILGFIIFGIGYNVLFLNEYISGSIYGSVPGIARMSVDYINANPEIKSVITYYDIGAYDLRLSGKYYSRFYTAPKRDYAKKLTEFRGHYMIVDFPAIDKNSPYWKLIERCPLVKEFTDKEIKSYIFDCRYLPATPYN